MTVAGTYLEKFQNLLHELFQFDCADLDFGIYRIMNYKRDVLEHFINEDLPNTISRELEKGELEEQSQLNEEFKKIQNKVVENLGPGSLDADGNLEEKYRDTEIGRKYIDLRNKTHNSKKRNEMEAQIFNHLYTFFNRYYQDGDFISKRRYSKKQKYAIPYNGEEVYMYWVNHDQYYVKSAEYFNNYNFKARGTNIIFELQDANIEKDNVKGEDRLFIPLYNEITWDEEKSQLKIPFVYRPLNEQEKNKFGKNKQHSIINEALNRIPDELKQKNLPLEILAERHRNKDGEGISFLEHHLYQYTKRNTTDFFIHKDLKGFLSRELDFYIKNEIFNIDEIEASGEKRAEGWFQLMKIIKNIGSQIIDFLSQVENFQKMLWEKKKFVTETQYCITVGNIDESFYGEIAECEEQWEEWKKLYHIHEIQKNVFTTGKNKIKNRMDFIKKHPTLVVDTKHFTPDFRDRVLASYDNIDGQVDGLLVRGENFQALGLLMEKYKGKIKCTYIDPPYNSSTTEILYKNNYKHSSWLTLMFDRISLSSILSLPEGVFVCAIDENEQERLGLALDIIFPKSVKTCVAILHNPRGIQGSGFSYTHEYAYFVHKEGLNLGKRILKNSKSKPLMKTGYESERFTAKSCFYPIYVKGGRVVRVGDIPPDEWHPSSSVRELENGEIEIWPISVTDNKERKWRYSNKSISDIKEQLEVKKGRNNAPVIYLGKSEESYRTMWIDPEFNAAEYGSTLLKNIVDEHFSFPKSIWNTYHALRVSRVSGKDILLDYFAGSGTTGHAAINLNREDGGKRKFILVEMGEYFDTVLLPRIKKITFTPEWKNGKPKRIASEEEAENSPRIIKYIRLESYEDALNNIEFEDTEGQEKLRFDDYLLKYMLKWETRKSETLLNVEKLANPFNYSLSIQEDGVIRETHVDMPETFNYLLGLQVKTRHVYFNQNNRYLVFRGTVEDHEIVVIWRETEGWSKKDYEKDKGFIINKEITKEADQVFINGSSYIPGAESIEHLFKKRMFSAVEV